MKIAISAAALLLFLGTGASVHARQDKPQDNHQQGQEAKHQARKPKQKGAKATQQHAKPANHAQHAEHPQQRPANHAQHANARPAAHAYGRISDTRYKASFGSRHRFHISRSDYQRRTFRYGGYSFRFVDPWPPAWSYGDPVYVVYLDGGYYMYDPVHPGLRITLTIF